MKKALAWILTLAMMLSLAACGGNQTADNNGADAETDGNAAAETDGNADSVSNADETPAPSGGANSIAVCLASEPDTIDPALNSSVDGASLVATRY